MLIRVTENHIRNGQPTHCFQCPIALAILDSVAECDPEVRVFVWKRAVSFRSWNSDYVIALPDICQVFIALFDCHRDDQKPFWAEEFEFDLNYHPPVPKEPYAYTDLPQRYFDSCGPSKAANSLHQIWRTVIVTGLTVSDVVRQTSITN